MNKSEVTLEDLTTLYKFLDKYKKATQRYSLCWGANFKRGEEGYYKFTLETRYRIVKELTFIDSGKNTALRWFDENIVREKRRKRGWSGKMFISHEDVEQHFGSRFKLKLLLLNDVLKD